MRNYEIRLKNGNTIYCNSKKAAKDYIENNRADIKGVYVLKGNRIVMFVTNQDIQTKTEAAYL
mgnify:CR=1 FL=1